MKTLSGDIKTLNEKGYQHVPLNMISLNKRVDDLVMLDDMNEALILHTLRQRCKSDSIYVPEFHIPTQLCRRISERF